MSNSDYIKKFNVNDDGTLTPVTISTMSDLSNNNVYIVVDENARKIFIWKGEKAPVRRKFISAKTAQQMRAEDYGMVYRIESLDPGLEGQDFLTIFGAADSISVKSPPTPTHEPIPTLTPKPAPTPAPKRAPIPTPKRAPKPAPASIAASTPVSTPASKQASKPAPASIATPTSASTPTPKRAQTPRIVKETEVVITEPVKTETVTVEEVTSKLTDLEIPLNMEREIIIIGNTVFSVIKEHLALFSKDVVKLEPMHDLPSGIFPADHYQVRLFIENGRVLFTEML
ncbi:MAG: hypothetical protein ACFFAU_17485, partial [Candidatus Hodarchaeota archaeon]